VLAGDAYLNSVASRFPSLMTSGSSNRSKSSVRMPSQPVFSPLALCPLVLALMALTTHDGSSAGSRSFSGV
jgi:hypothetical protein